MILTRNPLEDVYTVFYQILDGPTIDNWMYVLLFVLHIFIFHELAILLTFWFILLVFREAYRLILSIFQLLWILNIFVTAFNKPCLKNSQCNAGSVCCFAWIPKVSTFHSRYRSPLDTNLYSFHASIDIGISCYILFTLE